MTTPIPDDALDAAELHTRLSPHDVGLVVNQRGPWDFQTVSFNAALRELRQAREAMRDLDRLLGTEPGWVGSDYRFRLHACLPEHAK